MNRRGLTFIEVVVAVAMLATFATLVVGSIGYLATNAERNKHRLQAAELAHRVVVQYLDDSSQTPAPDQFVWQGDSRYRVETEVSILIQETSDISGLREGTSANERDVDLQDRVQSVHYLTVRVFKWEPTNEIDAAVPVAELTRYYYPFLVGDDWAQQWILDLITESAGPQTGSEDDE